MVAARKEDSTDGKFLKRVYHEAFKRTGKTFIYKYYPIKRGDNMLASGQVDGDLARISAFSEEQPDLIKVEESVLTINISAFATDPKIRLKSYSDLYGKNYIVEYVFGSAWIDDELSPYMKNGTLIHVYHWSNGLKNLAAGRTDIFICIERTVLGGLLNGKINEIPVYIAGIMATESIHAFFHKKHKNLAVKISTALREMKQEGLIERYRHESMVNLR